MTMEGKFAFKRDKLCSLKERPQLNYINRPMYSLPIAEEDTFDLNISDF